MRFRDLRRSFEDGRTRTGREVQASTALAPRSDACRLPVTAVCLIFYIFFYHSIGMLYFFFKWGVGGLPQGPSHHGNGDFWVCLVVARYRHTRPEISAAKCGQYYNENETDFCSLAGFINKAVSY